MYTLIHSLLLPWRGLNCEMGLRKSCRSPDRERLRACLFVGSTLLQPLSQDWTHNSTSSLVTMGSGGHNCTPGKGYTHIQERNVPLLRGLRVCFCECSREAPETRRGEEHHASTHVEPERIRFSRLRARKGVVQRVCRELQEYDLMSPQLYECTGKGGGRGPYRADEIVFRVERVHPCGGGWIRLFLPFCWRGRGLEVCSLFGCEPVYAGGDDEVLEVVGFVLCVMS